MRQFMTLHAFEERFYTMYLRRKIIVVSCAIKA